MIPQHLLTSLLLIVVSGQSDDDLIKPAVPISAFPSVAEQQEILDIHNLLRGSSNATGMQHMNMNADLASWAIQVAQTCILKHDMISGLGGVYPSVGQNIFMGSNFTYTSVTQGWFDQISDYDFETNSCSDDHDCEYYTQVVWDDTKHVGCGSHFCEEAINPLDLDHTRIYKNVHIVVCNYGPRGNYMRRPFEVGPPCTACSGGSSLCIDGLCDADCEGSECTCEAACVHGEEIEDECRCLCEDGWNGIQCDEICKDTHHLCGLNPGWSSDMCGQFPVDYYCHALCGECVLDLPDDCQNHHEFCGDEEMWPESACETSQYIRDYCPMMCGTCT